MPTTTTANLILPEVLADLVETKLGSRVTLLPLAVQDNTLAGQPGDTLNFPAFRYIGKADEIAENGEITPSLLTSFSVPATVKKYAKAVQITDEARLSGYGDPIGEAATQLAHSIDHAVDDALLAQLATAPFNRVRPITALSADGVADALTAFGEDLEGPAVILVDPQGFATLRKDPDYIRSSDLGQRAIFSGIVGEIWGCQILVSNKVKPATDGMPYYIVKPGALRLVNKQGTFIEVDREAKFMRDNIYASKHCAAYLYDSSKVVVAKVVTAVQVIALPTSLGFSSTAATGTNNTTLQIPAEYAAPLGLRWAYVLNTSASLTTTFGTAVAGSTDWVSGETVIAAAANTYAHLVLLDSENKPFAKASLPLVKGA